MVTITESWYKTTWETLRSLYREVLKRELDIVGAEGYLWAAMNGAYAEDIRQYLMESDEYKEFTKPKPVNKLEALKVSDLNFIKPDGSVFKWHGLTAFLLFKKYLAVEDLTNFLTWAKINKVNVLRVLGMVSWGPLDPRSIDNYYDRLREFARFINSQGFYLEFVIFADAQILMPDQVDQLVHAQRCVDALEGTYTFVEICNEPFKNGVDTKIVVPTTKLLLAEGNYDPYSLVAKDYLTIHTPRDGEWPRKAKDLAEYGFLGLGNILPFGVPCVADEGYGIGWFEEGNPQRSSRDRSLVAQDHADYAAVASLFGAGSTIHGDFGIHCFVPGDKEQACVDAIVKVWDDIPTNTLFGRYTAGHLLGCPFEYNVDNMLRVFGMITDPIATCVVVRGRFGALKPGWKLVETKGFNNNIAITERT